MTSIGAWLIQNAIVASVLAALLLLVIRFARPKPAVEHVLWLLLAVKFVLPPLTVLTLPAMVTASLPAVLIAPTEATSGVEGSDGGVTMVSEGRPTAGDPAAVAPIERSSRPGTWRSALERDDVVAWIVALWLLSAAAILARRTTSHVRWMRRVAGEGTEPTAQLLALVDEEARRLGVVAPRVLMTPGPTAPVVTGFGRPLLLWPAQLVPNLTAERTRTILAHELAHVRRRDLKVGALEMVVDALWWWYPGWRVVRRNLRDAAERACDYAVIESHPQSRRQYAEAILDVLSLGVRRRRDALSLGVDGPRPIERRLERILHARTDGRRARLGYAVAVLLAVVVAPGWTAIRVGPAVPATATRADVVPPSPEDAEIVGVGIRGVARWNDAGTLELEPNGWLVAFSGSEGAQRRLEVVRGADGTRARLIVDGREARVDAATYAWLRRVLARPGYDLARTRPGNVGSAASALGTHLNMINDEESLLFWATNGRGIGENGELDDGVDAQNPVYLIYQPSPDEPMEMMMVAREGTGVRVLDYSIAGRPAPIDDAATERARRTLRRAAEWR